MTTAKVLSAANNNSFSLSSNFKSIFSCCFVNNSNNNTHNLNQTDSNNGQKEKLNERNERRNDLNDCKAPITFQLEKRKTLERGENAEVEEEEENGHDQLDRRSELGDEFRDSAIDSISLSSQLNLRDAMIDQPEQTPKVDCQRNDLSSEPTTLADEPALSLTTKSPDEPTFVQDAAANGSEDSNVTQKHDDQVATQCGRIRMTVEHDAGHHRLSVTVHEADDIPAGGRVNLSHSEVHLLLNLSSKKIRRKTKAKSGENPHFEETFHFKAPSEEALSEGCLRVRLYRSETFKKELMIGETFINLLSILSSDITNPNSYGTWITLQPRFNHMNSTTELDDKTEGSLEDVSAQSRPTSELMLNLAYNSTTGRLTVEIVQGHNIKGSKSQKPPDTFVKLRLISPTGLEIGRSKTSVKHRQPNPCYKETFMFHVPEIYLPDVSLMVSVCEHRGIKNSQTLGWFTIGHTNSTEETKKHWTAMIESKEKSVSRWHALLIP